MFGVGCLVIDTKRKIAPTVCAVIADSQPTLYILSHEDYGYYIEEEDNLIEYDKYWFNKNK